MTTTTIYTSPNGARVEVLSTGGWRIVSPVTITPLRAK